MICTIGVAPLYGSFTYLVYNAQGLNILSNTKLTVFGRMPGILIVLALALAVFLVYSYLMVAGKRSKILANNQQVGVNIGINEKEEHPADVSDVRDPAGVCRCNTWLQPTWSPLSQRWIQPVPFLLISFRLTWGCLSEQPVWMRSGSCLLPWEWRFSTMALSCIGLGAGGANRLILGFSCSASTALMAQKDRLKEILKKKSNASA